MKYALLLLRLALGWLFLYAGITKIMDPSWSAAGYLNNAKTFHEFFAWFALPGNIGWVNFVNEWALLLIGIALILGLFTRHAAIIGIVLMALYYFPALDFPKIGEHSFLIDEHVIYAIALSILAAGRAGSYLGIDGRRR